MTENETAIVKATSFDTKALIDGDDMIYQTKWADEPTKLSLKIVKDLASTGQNVVVTDIEALVFARTCKQYGFDPFLREIYLIKYQANRPAANVIAAQTYLQIADGCPDYQGYEMGWIVSDSKGSRELMAQGRGVEPSNHIIGGWCQVFRKNRHTPIVEVLIKEFTNRKKDGEPNIFWKGKPESMIAKCARGTAHRITFPNLYGSNVITEDEASFTCSVNNYEPSGGTEVKKRGERTGDSEKDITIEPDEAITMGERFTELAGAINSTLDGKIMDSLYDQFISYVLGCSIDEAKDQFEHLTEKEIIQCNDALKDGLPQAIKDLVPEPVVRESREIPIGSMPNRDDPMDKPIADDETKKPKIQNEDLFTGDK